MTGEFESAGDAALGALTARAVEGSAGEAAHGAAGAQCLNCGTRLTGPYCRHCGQSGHIHRTVGAIGHDLAHGVLHLDGKTWRTLPMLAFRPGDLTRRYIAGERARFVSPLAVFLFSVFLMFAVVAQLPLFHFDPDVLKPGVVEGMGRARGQLAESLKGADENVDAGRARIVQERAKSAPDPVRLSTLEKRLALDIQERDQIIRAVSLLGRPDNAKGGDRTPAREGIGDVQVSSTVAPESANWLDAKLRHARENPKLLLYKLKTSAYKFSWALIPISLPLIWLLFPFRRDVGLYDHAVFATYSLAFMSLLVIALAVLVALGMPGNYAVLAATIIVPVHIYKQLKYAYRLSRPGALLRTVLMLGFAFFVLIFFTLGLLGMGVAD